MHSTYWSESSDAGGCQMPAATYAVTDAIALGQETALGNLAFRSGLCGQVLTINCGNGDVDAVVVSTCNIGSTTCGVDMIAKTWNKATNNASPGIADCTVVLSNKNPIAGSGPVCYHRPNSDIGNAYSVILSVLNTSGKIPSAATIADVSGRRGDDDWFIFDSAGRNLFTDDAIVNFAYEDGSSSSFKISECQAGGSVQIFK